MEWYKQATEILNEESETWLVYLRGQKTQVVPRLRDKPRYRGLFLQMVRYFAVSFRDLRLKKSSDLHCPNEYFVFASTINQMSALNQLIDSLREKNKDVLAVTTKSDSGRDHDKGRYSSFSLSFEDLFRSFVLVGARAPGLYRTLKREYPLPAGWHFSEFLIVYNYLCYFLRILKQVQPDFVITANDHNVQNRCMLAVAHKMGIKTVYLQHASVSSLFPALRVNYAFLDGQRALDVYRDCEANRPTTQRQAPVPHVFLTGQQKPVEGAATTNALELGVALNADTDIAAAIRLVIEIASESQKIRVRWHPGQSTKDVRRIVEAFRGNNHVTLSNPLEESVADFLGKIAWLVAANSSIHLEAALGNVVPIYYELTPSQHPDYYGFLKHGLARRANSAQDVRQIMHATARGSVRNADAVRYFSATYLSEWQGREGELVANCLIDLSSGKSASLLYGYQHAGFTVKT